jgi:acylphosphatase
MEPKICVHAVASGRVQGVCYRAFVQEYAFEFGVFGWVKNLPDGNVEAEIEGDASAVGKLLEAMRKGPMMAHVENVSVEPEVFEGKYRDFRVRF